ncbi:acyltransferase family protein [Burkholderia cepacia]|nr:acyltransferase family protein [Burkholderia cepacia]MCA8351444.1 acyltransferase family protein [Burkholderia cepacia]
MLLLFALYETGFIAGKQLYHGVYTDYKRFSISRFFRIFPPCWLMLGLSFLLMPNSMLYLREGGNVFSDITSLDLGDKIFYYASHVFLLINLLFYVSYDKATHSLDYFSIANHSSSVENAISLSVSPPLWTALPDVIIMLGFSYFFFKRRTNSLIVIYFLLIVAQCLIIAKTIFGDWEFTIIYENLAITLIFLMTGFFFGYREIHIPIKSKIKAGLLAFMLLPLLAIGTSAMEMTNNYYASILSFVIALVGYGVVCSLLWFAFSYKKFDMILRDLSVHIYLWHFMVYSIFYSYFKPEPISSIALIVGYMVVVSAFAYYFERYNRHFVNYLLKKTAKTSHTHSIL